MKKDLTMYYEYNDALKKSGFELTVKNIISENAFVFLSPKEKLQLIFILIKQLIKSALICVICGLLLAGFGILSVSAQVVQTNKSVTINTMPQTFLSNATFSVAVNMAGVVTNYGIITNSGGITNGLSAPQTIGHYVVTNGTVYVFTNRQPGQSIILTVKSLAPSAANTLVYLTNSFDKFSTGQSGTLTMPTGQVWRVDGRVDSNTNIIWFYYQNIQ